MTGAPFTGVSAGGGEAISMTPLTIDPQVMQQQAVLESGGVHLLSQLDEEMHTKLLDYLCGRLSAGDIVRNRKIRRYARIDRTISTWQKLNPEDSEREKIEDATGKQMALPFNLPILASHLDDMVSYFAEALAPISNPFFSASGEGQVPELLKKFNRDAAARDYFGELQLTLRSLLKYNIGGLEVDWVDGTRYGGDSGNRWTHLDMYNTMWDPSIRDPKHVACKGEWAATVTLENRLTLVQKSLAGEWYGLEEYLKGGYEDQSRGKWYKEAASQAALGEEGSDSRTSNAKNSANMNWDSWGIGLASDMGPEINGFEIVNMYCWLVPAQFGLLTDAERLDLEKAGKHPDAYLELWKFKVLGDRRVVDAEPVIPRDEATNGEKVEIPIYLSFLKQDQLKEAQRSFMELMRGFQRFGSNMFNIYIAGMRKNVWGVKGIDPTMFDTSKLRSGEPVGLLESKQPGRDVRTGMMTLESSAGVENAMNAVAQTMDMKNQMFPSQALPSQIAGIDRAVKNQVTTVVQGATRSLRTMLRTLDTTLMLPSRMGGFRNLKRLDPTGIDQMSDEQVAKMLGSGIESMESERVLEILWQLLYAIIQNQESMTLFNVPAILTYMSRVGNMSVDLGQFAREPAQPATPPEGAMPAQQPPPQA